MIKQIFLSLVLTYSLASVHANLNDPLAPFPISKQSLSDEPSLEIDYLSDPLQIRGLQIKNRFLSGYELDNVIRWVQPSNTCDSLFLCSDLPVLYLVYRDAALTELAATIPAEERMVFIDYRVEKGVVYTYYIVSVFANGSIFTPIPVTIQPKSPH